MNRYLLFSIFLLLLAWATTTWADELPQTKEAIPKLPENIIVLQDIVYKELDPRPLKLDLYQPQKMLSSALPLVVYFHGNGYRKGSKEEILEIAFFRKSLLELTQEGKITVASVDFRKGSKKAPLRSLIEDCKEAIRWLRQNSEKYRIDFARIGLLGNASGGHLALMAGLTSESAFFAGDVALGEISKTISFIIAIAPPTDLLRVAEAVAHNDGQEEKKIRRQLKIGLEGEVDEVPENYAKASPINFIQKNSPPVLVIIGREDTLFEQVKRFQEVGEKAEADLQVIAVERAGSKLYKGFPDMSPTLPELKVLLQQFMLKQFNLKTPVGADARCSENGASVP